MPVAESGFTIATEQGRLYLPASALHLAGFRAWAKSDQAPEKLRLTFFAGRVFVDATPEEMQTHIAVKGEVGRVLGALSRRHRLGKFYGSGASFANEAAELFTRTDGLFLAARTLLDKKVRFAPDTIEGTPDLVVEVIGAESVEKDTVWLRQAYHRAGIPEYWLVDAREELVFQILLRRKNGYVAAPLKDGWQRSKVFGRSFRFDRTLDDFGLWDYTLHVRED
jgi:Uma2 family endonuclease